MNMLRKDVLVKRPEGTKIYRQRDCVYVYHVTGSEYKKDKKYVVEKRVCIGKMVDDENMNPNDNFYQYYEIVDGNEEEPPRFSDAVQIGAPALLFKIMDELKLSELLHSIHGECQLSFADATRKYVEAGKDLEGKGFDPRKLLAPGAEAIKATVKEKMELFGSVGKA